MMATKNITGVLKKVEWAGSQNDPYLKATIQRPGKGSAPDGGMWPESFNGFHIAGLEWLIGSEGDTVTLVVQESDKLNTKGNPYWNLVNAFQGNENSAPPDDMDDLPWEDEEPLKESLTTIAPRTSPEPRSRPERPVPEHIPDPRALGACQMNAMDMINDGLKPVPEGMDPIVWLKILRDRIYWQGNQVDVGTGEYCPEHMVELIKSPRTGQLGHLLEDGSACIGKES
jgi:hypothetical protein